ncbi:MAG: beta-lactamase family protein [Myxococcales bacterium]|nr:beta-lactamase family protein [Myxococcales bacterium]
MLPRASPIASSPSSPPSRPRRRRSPPARRRRGRAAERLALPPPRPPGRRRDRDDRGRRGDARRPLDRRRRDQGPGDPPLARGRRLGEHRDHPERPPGERGRRGPPAGARARPQDRRAHQRLRPPLRRGLRLPRDDRRRPGRRGAGPPELRRGRAPRRRRRADPHRADQRFRLGTLSQQITASAVLLLVERGLLGLDDPIRKHLPGYPEVGDRITIRHLLSHTSGIPSFTDDPLFDGWRGQPHTTSELLDRFKELPLEFQPGADFDPSNSGYAVLGAVIEAVSGVSHGEYIRREIFEPLGMTRSSVGEPSGGAMVIPGYLFDEDEALNAAKSARVDLTAFGAAGDVVTTADDLTRWASALFGGELLRPETVELMLTPVTEDGYALGWILGDANGQRIAEHPGGSEGVNAAIRYYRSDHALVVAVANNDVIDCREMVEKVGDLAHGRPAAWPLEYEEVTPDAARFPLYVGEYALSDESRESLARYFEAEEIDRLATAQVLVDGGRLFFWVPGHGTKWMHARGGDSYFFKDASRTTATFQLELRADEHVVNPGAFRQGGERPGGAVDLGPASALILHQGALDIVLERRAGSDAEPLVLPSP